MSFCLLQGGIFELFIRSLTFSQIIQIHTIMNHSVHWKLSIQYNSGLPMVMIYQIFLFRHSDCPPVPSVNQATADTNETKVGTTVTYTCDQFGHDFIQGHPGKTTCSRRGAWGRPPTCRSKCLMNLFL